MTSGDGDWIIWLLVGLTVLFSFKRETRNVWFPAVGSVLFVTFVMMAIERWL